MHPNTDQSLNYTIPALVAGGYAVLGRAGRWHDNDGVAVQEPLMADMASGIEFLRAQGCEQVVLLGSARGGALAALYQGQARSSAPGRLTDTAAGDPYDLNPLHLPAADGVVLIGQHLGGGYSLLKWIDPSVLDESEPLGVDSSLDMYDAANGFCVPPEPSSYSTEFLDRYRAAQQSRVRRLEHLAREAIASRSAGGDIVYMRIARVVADPAFIDLAIEPDDRDVCSFANDPRPDLANQGLGYIPAVTPAAFLSTWCEFTTRTRTAECIRRVADPLLVVHYAGDSATRTSEARSVFENSSAADKEFVLVRHADHFGFRIIGPHQRGERVSDGTDAVVRWMRERFPL